MYNEVPVCQLLVLGAADGAAVVVRALAFYKIYTSCGGSPLGLVLARAAASSRRKREAGEASQPCRARSSPPPAHVEHQVPAISRGSSPTCVPRVTKERRHHVASFEWEVPCIITPIPSENVCTSTKKIACHFTVAWRQRSRPAAMKNIGIGWVAQSQFSHTSSEISVFPCSRSFPTPAAQLLLGAGVAEPHQAKVT